MKSIYTLVVAFLVIQGIFAQDTLFIRSNSNWDAVVPEYETDTLVFASPMERRNMLIGNEILYNTGNLNHLDWIVGLRLTKVDFSECRLELPLEDESGNETTIAEEFVEGERINSVTFQDSIMTIDINIETNCCSSLLYEAKLDNDGTLRVIYHDYGGACACSCCFGLVYQFEANEEFDPEKIKAVIINDKEETFYKVDLK